MLSQLRLGTLIYYPKLKESLKKGKMQNEIYSVPLPKRGRLRHYKQTSCFVSASVG
jgi:hypothetical protein